MTALKLAPGLTLPLDAATQRLAILGRIGSGKTYLATKLAELMLDAGAQVVALDPVGKWYGLRVPGTGKAYPIPVFGGLHGDLPIESTGGALMADVVVDRGLSCVIDVSQFETDAAKARFAAGFAERFFWRKKAAPSAVHLFLEECQEFVPQNPARTENDMLHYFTRMAKLGRNFGIGISLVSQRPQEVNKKVLNLTECMIALQMRGKQERETMRDWATAKDVDLDVIKRLPHLDVGQAIVDSPQWLKVSGVEIRAYPKRTADVSATPDVGAESAEAKPLSKVDIEELRGQMAATVEKAKADDPKALRARIRELEQSRVSIEARDAQIDAAVAEAVRVALADYQGVVAGARQGIANIMGPLGEIHALVRRVIDDLQMTAAAIDVPPPAAEVRAFRREAEPLARTIIMSGRQSGKTAAMARAQGDAKVGRTGAKILAALAFYESVGTVNVPATWAAAFVGMSSSGGSWGARVSEVRTAGFLETGAGQMWLTDGGRAIADTSNVPRSRRELHDLWRAKLGGKAREMFEFLLTMYPDPVARETLAKAVEMEVSGGSFGARLSELRSPGLLDETVQKGLVRASDVLFPKGLR